MDRSEVKNTHLYHDLQRKEETKIPRKILTFMPTKKPQSTKEMQRTCNKAYIRGDKRKCKILIIIVVVIRNKSKIVTLLFTTNY